MPKPDAPRRERLDRAKIVSAAVALADDEGVGGLTMRHLAERLGFRVMALYNHVANKDHLLALMVDAVAAGIDDPAPDIEPLAAVRSIAISTRAAFVLHPWAPELWLRHLPGPARTGQMDNLLRILSESGLDPDLAHHGFHAVTNHVLGYTLQAQAMALDTTDTDDQMAMAHDYLASISAEAFPHMVAHVRQHLDGDTASSFELVLDLILDGLERLQQSR